jgi:hypothetical protein
MYCEQNGIRMAYPRAGITLYRIVWMLGYMETAVPLCVHFMRLIWRVYKSSVCPNGERYLAAPGGPKLSVKRGCCCCYVLARRWLRQPSSLLWPLSSGPETEQQIRTSFSGKPSNPPAAAPRHLSLVFLPFFIFSCFSPVFVASTVHGSWIRLARLTKYKISVRLSHRQFRVF